MDYYHVFVAVETGTEMEEFMDHMCETPYVKGWEYKPDPMISDALFYCLDIPDQKDAWIVANCINVTVKLGIKEGRCAKISVGKPNSTLDEFIARCKK